MSNAPSLIRWHMARLASVFVAYAFVLAILFTLFMALPMSRRSADDLAGLMVLSAQTWAELPPETRPALIKELRTGHGLILAPRVDYTPVDELHRPFAYLLEAALTRRLGHTVHLHAETVEGEAWFWVNLPAGAEEVAIGLPHRRYNGQPLVAIGGGLTIGLVLALVLSAWLAGRLSRPIRQIEAAMDAFGRDATAPPVPETGPREIASLGRHFNAMTRQVRDLVAARTLLLAGISHDLRTPLARMRLGLELARSKENAGRIDGLERDIARMDALIGQSLDLARGLDPAPTEQVEIASFLASFVAEAPELRVEIEAPTQGLFAPQALRRALTNLIENAQRHATGGEIVLRAEQTGDTLRFGVLDQGPGIPENRISLMCEPFERLEPSRSPKTGGSGLGLAIVRELARANGWALKITNRAEGGLAVWITLP
ncbi:two-component system osmolarity sensor histidine kinase EnvZ [Rhodobacter sp. JA431]|uniref:ATP-binding protein n=1 Tax=Rhodobacter sp. JA431 TaxID=570013 RepID=UPI000BCDFB15|nr:ATP-binding protein [Rhodobacter sp. JA431]SOC04698.1 two-component system osmolarity sensor histidine kinase EnvZ [Rhodobacter sp. JA431]